MRTGKTGRRDADSAGIRPADSSRRGFGYDADESMRMAFDARRI